MMRFGRRDAERLRQFSLKFKYGLLLFEKSQGASRANDRTNQQTRPIAISPAKGNDENHRNVTITYGFWFKPASSQNPRAS